MVELEGQSVSKQTQRLEAFSDGVFAIAITLLVLAIRLPAGEAEGGLLAQLVAIWPTYLAYLISFITIGIMWTNHDMLLRDIKRADRAFVLMNALLLMVITFLNFPTVILAEYLQTADANVAAMFYCATLFVIGLIYNAMWWYAAHDNRLLDTHTDPVWRDTVTRQYRFGPLFYVAAFVLAIFSPLLSLSLTLALGVYFALAGRRSD